MIATRLAAGLCLAAAAALSGCAADSVRGIAPQPAGLAPAGLRPAATKAASAPACAFSIAGIEDQREDTNLGSLGPTVIAGDDFGDWFRGSIESIPGYSGDTRPLSLRIDVIKAYVQGIGTLKNTNIVVRVLAFSDGDLLEQKTYRGADGSMNWNNGEGEVQSALGRAMASMTTQIGADVQRWCGSVQRTPTTVTQS